MEHAKETNVKARFDRLAPRIDDTFHLPVMMWIILGDETWSKTTGEDRKKLIAAFRRMSITTLATLFDGYSGEVFEVVNKKPGHQDTLLVETLLKRPDDSPVDIAYVVKEFKIGWRIIDVIVDKGISELSVRRSEYRRILKDSGVQGLTNALNEKAESLIKGE